jgi:Domain of unknown function (DUF4781)
MTGLVAADAAATIGVSAYGLYQGYDTLHDRGTHGQSWTDLRDSEVRNAYFGMTADALGILAVGSMLRVGRSGLRMISSAEEMTTAGRVANISSQYADTAAIGNSGATLAIDWEKMTPEQRWTIGAQMGFWGLMTGVSAQRNGGLGNLYGKEDFQNLMARMQGQKPATVPGASTTTTVPETGPAATLTTLRSNYEGHSFAAAGEHGQTVSINGQINLHPEKLAQLQAENSEAFQQLLQGTKALDDVGGDFSRLRPQDQKILEKLSSSGGQRLRFGYQLNQQVDGFLAQHNVQEQPVFRNMSEVDRARLFDVINERPKQLPNDPRQVQALNLEEQQAVNYAISQKPKSVNEFVEQVQMYKAVLAAERRSQVGRYESAIKYIAQEKYGVSDLESLTPKQRTEIRRQASQKVFGKAFDGAEKVASREAYIQSVESASSKDAPEKVNSVTQSKVEQAYLKKAKLLEGKTGSIKVNLDQNSEEIAQKIQELNSTGNIKFGSETAGVYHIEKHYEAEFPKGEQKASKTDVDSYLASASETIRQPTRQSPVEFDQFGNRVIKYERDIIDEKGEIRTGLAIVKVSPNGDTSLATYQFK